MLKLEQIQKNAAISGLEPGQVVRIVTTEPVGDNALTVYYKKSDGQWQDEMFEKFGLSFTLFSREQVEQSRSGNPFDDIDLMVARVDQLSRNEDLQEKPT